MGGADGTGTSKPGSSDGLPPGGYEPGNILGEVKNCIDWLLGQYPSKPPARGFIPPHPHGSSDIGSE